jgi:hypothetical protein
MKIKPIQIWFPGFGGSIHRPKVRSDAMRAFRLQSDELVVWMLPEITRTARWREGEIGSIAIPSEEFERIDVAHVSQDGRIHARGMQQPIPATIDGLLEDWLNCEKIGTMRFFNAPNQIGVRTPYLNRANRIGWRKRPVVIGPGSYTPISSLDSKTRKVVFRLSPEDSRLPISPEVESAERFPSKKLEFEPSTVITEQGDRALHVLMRWPGRLESLMPVLSGPDDLLARSQMAQIAVQSASDLTGALNGAKVSSQPYLFSGYSTIEHALFRPMLQQKGPKHILLKAESWNLPLQSRDQCGEKALNDLLKQEAWKKWLRTPVPIRRAWGAVGLFWTLLLDRLEAGQLLRACERCNRIITGKDGKRFCAESDDRDCFIGRRASDQQRSRRSRSKNNR